MIGIYRILCKPTGDSYIGRSTEAEKRKTGHFGILRMGKHTKKFQALWNEHGEAQFEFEILEECCRDDLIRLESKWIDELRPSLNTFIPEQNGGTRVQLDRKATAIYRELMKLPLMSSSVIGAALADLAALGEAEIQRRVKAFEQKPVMKRAVA